MTCGSWTCRRCRGTGRCRPVRIRRPRPAPRWSSTKTRWSSTVVGPNRRRRLSTKSATFSTSSTSIVWRQTGCVLRFIDFRIIPTRSSNTSTRTQIRNKRIRFDIILSSPSGKIRIGKFYVLGNRSLLCKTKPMIISQRYQGNILKRLIPKMNMISAYERICFSSTTFLSKKTHPPKPMRF